MQVKGIVAAGLSIGLGCVGSAALAQGAAQFPGKTKSAKVAKDAGVQPA